MTIAPESSSLEATPGDNTMLPAVVTAVSGVIVNRGEAEFTFGTRETNDQLDRLIQENDGVIGAARIILDAFAARQNSATHTITS